jgi:peptidoglycan/LPS O-acetylase OafA/YrhL
MFFILSGFVNSMSLLRRRKPVDFVAARLIRIIPVFLLAIVANLWILSWAPMHQQVSTGQFVANMTLMPMVLGFDCVDPVMWTLQIEMLFYASLVILFTIGGLKRYFLGWGTLLLLSVVVCPTLDGLESAHGDAGWFAVATAIRRLMVLDFVPLFTMGFLIYMIKTGTGKRWQNLLGIAVAAAVFHTIDHGKHNPVATLLILGLVTLCAYGRAPMLRFRPLVFISTISYALYLCHNNLGCVLIHRFDHSGIPPQVCFVIAVVFSIAMAIIVTNRIEQPITNLLRNAWSRFRAPKQRDAEVATAN